MKILVACEESQAVTIELRKLGHEAFSCDLFVCSGGHPEWHIQNDVLQLINKSNNDRQFKTQAGKFEILPSKGWDIMIAFPPCTHLAVSGARHFEKKRKDGRQRQGIDFFMKLVNAPINKIAIENPVGIMSSKYRKPDQIIQPWQFGDEAQKATCIWLKGLPLLKSTKIVGKGRFYVSPGSGKIIPEWYNKNNNPNKGNRQKSRSVTFPGIAKAMAEQWTDTNRIKNQYIQQTIF